MGDYLLWLRGTNDARATVRRLAELDPGRSSKIGRKDDLTQRAATLSSSPALASRSSYDPGAGSVSLTGNSIVVPRKLVEAMRLEPESLRVIHRLNEEAPKDRTMSARRLLRCPITESFQAMDLYRPTLKAEVDDTFCTVLRAPMAMADVHQVLDLAGALNGSVIDMTFSDQPQPVSPTGAHGPLYVSGLKREDMSRPDKLRIAKEYLAPWRINDAFVTAAASADPIPDAIVMRVEGATGDVRFDRIDWLERGRVHNFESMLALMQNKYLAEPRATSDLMEDFYLG